VTQARPIGAKLLDEAHATLTTYVVFPCPEAADAVTLFAAATHAAHRLEFATRLAIGSPQKRCGKSRLEDILAGLVARPLLTTDISAAALVRSITENSPPTIMLDEADAIFGKALKGDEKAEHLRGILNAGFGRNRPYRRWDATRREMENCPTFAMAVIAGIGRLPDTIEDRAVIIKMRRRAPHETVARYRIRRDGPKVAEVGKRLAAWVRDRADDIGAAEPTMPTGLNDRAEDAWEALIAVADLAGGNWPERARAAAAAISSGADEPASASLRLLADLRVIFDDADALWTETILGALHKTPEAPWADWYGKPITDRGIAKLLEDYGIKSCDVKLNGTNRKGYRREHLWDAWIRYIPDTPSATSATSATSQVNPVADEKSQTLPALPGSGGSGSAKTSATYLTWEDAQVAQVADTPPESGPARRRRCDFRGCKQPARAYRDGTYCDPHAGKIGAQS
jgi:hypothetical protein